MSEKEISDKMNEIMSRIKKRRLELDMSYQALSEKTGMSKSTLQRYETGQIRNMPIDKLEDVAKALGVSPSYLMGWTDEEPTPAPAPTTLAAHFEGEEFTDAEAEEIKKFADFVKSKRKE